MKQGWEIKKLGEVAYISPSKSEVKTFALNPMDMVSFLPMEDLTIGRTFVQPNKQKTLSEVEGSYTYFKEGDVLLAKVTPCFENGKLAIAKSLCNNIGFGSSEYIVIRPMQHSINSQYLLYSLQTNAFRNGGKALMIGACGLKRLPKPYVANYELPVPPLAEQERIVGILDKEFERIDALKANAEQNLQHAKDLFQSALKQELQPKEGWNKYLLSDICEYRKEQGKHTNLPYVGMENIETGTGKLLGNQKGEDILSSTFRFQRGYVMYGRLRPYLKKVFVSDFEGCCSTEIFPIVTNGILPHLLKFWFLEDSITDKINQTCGGCRMPRANMNQVMQFDIWLPKLDVQTEIVARLEKLNTNCSALEENYKKTIVLCDDMKQALLRKAFNGEL